MPSINNQNRNQSRSQSRSRQQSDLNQKPRYCHFCVHGMSEIDFKDVNLLRRFTSSYAKIVPKRKSGVCSTHQRKLSQAIKRARVMALLPYVNQ